MIIVIKKGDKVLNLESVMLNKSTERKAPFDIRFANGERIKSNVKPIVKKKPIVRRKYA